jgi:hypothetical protein
MAISHYTYLILKILGPNGVITVKESFELSNAYDKEFYKMAQTFGMTAKYARLKGVTDHNILPNVVRSQTTTYQAFNSTRDAKKVWVHPTDPNKTTSIASELTSA